MFGILGSVRLQLFVPNTTRTIRRMIKSSETPNFPIIALNMVKHLFLSTGRRIMTVRRISFHRLASTLSAMVGSASS